MSKTISPQSSSALINASIFGWHHDGSSIKTAPATSANPGKAIKRFNMFNSATISGEAAHGYSSGQAMSVLESIVRKHFPASVGVEWS